MSTRRKLENLEEWSTSVKEKRDRTDKRFLKTYRKTNNGYIYYIDREKRKK